MILIFYKKIIFYEIELYFFMQKKYFKMKISTFLTWHGT
jgi:hypothetical protein